MSTLAVVSFRLGGPDGVSVEAAKWIRAFERLGHRTYTVAGGGPVDHLLPGLNVRAPDPPSESEIAAALEGADVVVVENVLSIPHLNPGGAGALARVLRGRPAVLHHHDLPWVRPEPIEWPAEPFDDAAWRHVTINRMNQRGLADRGVDAAVVYNAFVMSPEHAPRDEVREQIEVTGSDLVVLHPVRAIPRKNIAGAVAFAEALGAVYWLLGPAEDGYEGELEAILAAALGRGQRVIHGAVRSAAHVRPADAYAAADAVVLPSTWEGFGNATIESAVHRKPLAIGRYPVASELRAFGFRWFDADDPGALARFLDRPDPALLDHNREVASQHFDVDALPARLAQVLDGLL